MDMQYLDDTPAVSRPRDEALTFQWLYARVQRLSDHSIYPKAGAVERWSMRIGVVAAAIGVMAALLLDQWLPADISLQITLLCLLLEITGFSVGGGLMLHREYRQYLQPKLSHAREMDGEFEQWQGVVAQIRDFPKVEREQRLRYVTVLRNGMVDRMGLLYGGLQRLGPFPLLIALYVQYRGWRKGGWAGVFDVGWAGGLLIASIVLLYLIGWMTIIQRMRLETYLNLLEASLQEPKDSTP